MVAVREGAIRRRFGWRASIGLCGPAVVASVAYMDPGNFATNIQAGSSFGYGLLWVVALANAMAMIFQAMAAKIGIVTGRHLAELCREAFPQPMVVAMWLASEIAAMATDLAEFLGGAVGLSLLCGLPLLAGMGITALFTYAVLAAQRSGRALEVIVGGFVGAIGVSYLLEIAIAPPDWRAAALQTVVPHLAGPNALALAVGIVGATVMPHAIFLHSALTSERTRACDDEERRRLVRFSHREVVVALTFAGAVNIAMVLMAATVFHPGHAGVAQIDEAYHTLVPLLGAGAAGIFLFSLMASGISSSVVGTLAGQVIMQGFVGFRIPLGVRRLVTIVPSFAVVALGIDATHALVVSQIILSLILPVPVLALIVLSRRRSLMGSFASSRRTTVLASIAACVVLGLNLVLLGQTVGLVPS